MINAVTDIQEDTLVELVINSQPLSDEDVEIRPHSLAIHSYKTPTFCHFCGEMLFGMFKQVKTINQHSSC
jgi:protein kinase D